MSYYRIARLDEANETTTYLTTKNEWTDDCENKNIQVFQGQQEVVNTLSDILADLSNIDFMKNFWWTIEVAKQPPVTQLYWPTDDEYMKIK